jgi:hypothetical protein
MTDRAAYTREPAAQAPWCTDSNARCVQTRDRQAHVCEFPIPSGFDTAGSPRAPGSDMSPSGSPQRACQAEAHATLPRTRGSEIRAETWTTSPESMSGLCRWRPRTLPRPRLRYAGSGASAFAHRPPPAADATAMAAKWTQHATFCSWVPPCTTSISFSGTHVNSSMRGRRRPDVNRTRLAVNQRGLFSTISPILLPIRTRSRGKH